MGGVYLRLHESARCRRGGSPGVAVDLQQQLQRVLHLLLQLLRLFQAEQITPALAAALGGF